MADAPTLDDRIRRSAAPERVRGVLDRLAERDPGARDRLEADPALAGRAVAVAAASGWLGRLLATDAEALDVLADLDRRRPADVSDGQELARWRHLEHLRIAARDLTGVDVLEGTMALVSAMAASVLDAAVRLAGAGHLAVVAMGKAGGNELNYASDVDVVLVGPSGDRDDQAAARHLLEVARHALRVDVDLRPGGRDGSLVRSLDGYRAHWERWAEPWERQALLKARPLVGDLELGAAFEAAADEQVWERGFDEDAIHQVREMKARTEHHAGEARDAARDIKRTPGGLRDIEFTVQLLQLVHGPLDDALRVRGTLPALTALVDGGYVAEDDGSWLQASYRFLRRIEHAVQLDEDRQVHAVPADPGARAVVARVLGLRDRPSTSALDELDRELAACRAVVRGIHERIYFRPLLDAFTGVGAPLAPEVARARLAAFGFSDADRTRQAVEEMTRGLTRRSRLMARMLPLLLDWLSSSPDPDQGLLALRTLVAADAGAVATAFRESPETARRICILAGTSPSLVRDLARQPEALPRSRVRPPAEELAEVAAAGVAKAVARARGDDVAAVLRRAVRRERVRIGAADVLDDLELPVVGGALAAVGRAAVQAALDAADPQVPLLVLALGRLARGELAYASDLDLVFLHGASGDEGQAEALRATEAVRRTLGGTGPADRVYAIDVDLRPGGRSAPVVRSVDSLLSHLERWAEPWERLAFSIAQPLTGDEALAQRVAEEAMPLVCRPLDDHDRRAIRRVKARMEAERVPAGEDPAFHLKLGPGALADVELTIDLLRLEHGGGEQRRTTDAIRALRDAGVLSLDEAAALSAAHGFCELARNRWTLVAGRPRDSLPTGTDLTTLARSLGTTGPELREEYRRRTRRARAVVERRFYGRSV